MNLILVPQYPAKLRYQEWWYTEFQTHLRKYFDDILVLGQKSFRTDMIRQAVGSEFSPIDTAIEFELAQIREYLELDLWDEDVLLLNDLSFPGIFANVLYHRKPRRCYAICHATSKNRHDYFQYVRHSKYPNEVAISQLFDLVFVASRYHARKLGWKNLEVVGLPLPPFLSARGVDVRERKLVSVSRPGRQKSNAQIERQLARDGFQIERPEEVATWTDYYDFLRESEKLLSTAKEETFGYQIVDAILNGCVPIAPNTCSYPELLPRGYLYDNYEELVMLLRLDRPCPELLNYDLCVNFYDTIGKLMTVR